jgi:hypothetical protein
MAGKSKRPTRAIERVRPDGSTATSGGHGDQERSRDGAFALSWNRTHVKRKPLQRLAFAIG